MSSTDGQLTKLVFKPGVNRQSTRYVAEGTWYDSDRVRFRQGLPENMKGVQLQNFNAFLGTGRAIRIWQDLQGITNEAFGTEVKLYVAEGSIYDITPVDSSITVSSAFSTSIGSMTIFVCASTPSALTNGSYIVVTSFTNTIGGNIYLAGQYVIANVSGQTFTINSPIAAAATSISTGQAAIQFLLPSGTSSNGFGFGYGTGTYGTGTYGTSGGSGIVVNMREWSLDLWGENLIANPSGGRVYVWVASTGPNVRAQVIANSPTQTNSIIVSPEDRHLVCLGCTDVITSIYDPLLVQWSDTNNYNVFTPTVTNTAGNIRLGAGTNIVGAVRSRNQINIFTDQTMHSMTFIGPPFTFEFHQIGSECGLISPHGAVEFAGKTYWMSNHNFYSYDGAIKDMNCTVLKYIFDDINLFQATKIYAGSNTEFSELIWLYPSKNSNEIDRYVIYDILEDAWAIGTYTFSAWADQGVVQNVVGLNAADSMIYDIEVSGIYTSNGQPMTSYLSSGQIDLGDGNDMMFVDKVIPDFDFVGGNNFAEITVNTVKYPNSPVVPHGPYAVSDSTLFVPFRARGRQIAIKVGVSNGNSGWRMGYFRFNIQPDGQQ